MMKAVVALAMLPEMLRKVSPRHHPWMVNPAWTTNSIQRELADRPLVMRRRQTFQACGQLKMAFRQLTSVIATIQNPECTNCSRVINFLVSAACVAQKGSEGASLCTSLKDDSSRKLPDAFVWQRSRLINFMVEKQAFQTDTTHRISKLMPRLALDDQW